MTLDKKLPEMVKAYTKASDPSTRSLAATRGSDEILELVSTLLESNSNQDELVRYVWGAYANTLWGTGTRAMTLGLRDGNLDFGRSPKDAGFIASTKLEAAVMWIITIGALRQHRGIKVPTNNKGQELARGAQNVILPGAVASVNGRAANNLRAMQTECLSMLGIKACTPKAKDAVAFKKAYDNIMADLLGEDAAQYETRLDETAKVTGFSKLQLKQAMAAIAVTAYDAENPPITIGERPVVEYILNNWYVGGQDYKLNMPENLYLVDSWALYTWWEHSVSPQEVILAFLLVKAALPVNTSNQLKLGQFEDSDGTVTRLFFESHYLDVTTDGVYDDRRRRFNKAVVINNELSKEPSKDELFLVNGYGTALLALVNNAYRLNAGVGKTYSKVGDYYKSLVDGLTYPMDSEEESGGVADRGDRLHYSLGIAKAVASNGRLPFICVGEYGARLSTSSTMTSYEGSKPALDNGAFELGLTRMHKGEMPFIPASMIAVQLQHFPVSEQDNVLKHIVNKIHPGVSVADALRKLFPEFANWQDDAVIQRAKEQLCLGQSTKLAKISKRVGVAYPKHAEPLMGEDRAFRRYGQTVGYAPGHTYNVAFCQRAIYTPGATIQLAESLKPVLNKHSYKQEFEFFSLGDVRILGQAIELVNGKCELDFSKQSTLIDEVDVPGVYYPKNESVAVVPYASKDGKVAINQFIAMPQEGVVLKVVCDLNNFGALRVNLQYATVETVGKLRSNVKTLPVKTLTGKGCLYNWHNDTLNIPEGVDLVVPGDADKSKDLMESLLDVAAQTAIQTPEGRAKVVALNAAIGVKDNKGLVYSPAAAVMGLYDSFLKEFEADYGADIWLYHRDCADNIVKAIRELYLNKAKASVGGWHVVKPGKSKLLIEHGFEHALVLANGDPDVLTTDVLVFYEDPGLEYPEVMYQRTYGFVGSAEKGHVRLSLKFELSSVAQAVSQSKLMASVIRAVATGLSGVPGDLEGAQALTKNCPKDMQTFIHFTKMFARRPFKSKGFKFGRNYLKVLNKRLPVVNCFTEQMKLTTELATLLTTANLLTKSQEASLTLGDLASAFKKVVFRLPSMGNRTPDLYLPAIAAKDLKAGSTESLSGLILTLFRLLIVAAHTGGSIEPSVIKSRVNRISGAFGKLMESEGFIKALTNGRMSAQCKLLGVFGVPVGEMWVLQSANSGSFYQCLKKVFTSADPTWSLDKVGVARSPMPFFAGVKVVVINGSDPRAQVLNDYQAAVSPLLCYINAGDHDGDDFVSCPANDVKIPFVDYDLVMRVVEDRIGKHPLSVEVDAYIADHYGIKKYKPLSCWGEANLTMLVRTPDEDMAKDEALAIERKGLKSMLWHATSLQQGAIGEGHEYAYTAECAVSIVSSLLPHLTEDEGLLLSSWLKDSTMTLPLYELYENPLGGFSWETWDALKVILGIMKGVNSGKYEDILVNKLESDLDKGGMASGRLYDFIHAANFVNSAREQENPTPKDCSIIHIVGLAAEIMFLISKADFHPYTAVLLNGKADPNSHAAMAACYLAWQPARRKELTKHSILLQVVEHWLTTVGRAVDPNSMPATRSIRLQSASKMGYVAKTIPGTAIVKLEKPTK